MYEVGRESERDHPTPLLKIVCAYYAGELGGGEDDAVDSDAVPPPCQDDFRKDDGRIDRAAFIRALNEHQKQQAQEIIEPKAIPVTKFHYAVARFISQRRLEAQMVTAHGVFPRGVPYDQQADWKWQLWNQYWSGSSDARDMKMS